MAQKKDPVTWLEGLDNGLLEERAEKAYARLRSARNRQELAALIRQVLDDLRQMEAYRKDLIVGAFLDPADRGIRESLDRTEEGCLAFLCEYSRFFASISKSSKGLEAASLIGPDLPAAAKNLAASYQKKILPDLQKEKDLIAGQLKRLDELSLSSLRTGAVMGEARRMLQSHSRERRMRAYRSLAGRLARYRDEVEKHFVQLHETRRSMAGQAGFKTFFDYALARSGLTEEKRMQATAFRQLAQKHLTPLVPAIRASQWKRLGLAEPKPWDVIYPASFGVPTLDLSAYPLEKTYLKGLRSLLGPRAAHFESMGEAGALSFHVTGEPRQDPDSFDYCAADPHHDMSGIHFPDTNRSYLLLPPLPQEWFASTVFAETGSILIQLSGAQELPWPLASPEAGMRLNLARYSLSMLSQRVWGLFYGIMARYAREYDMAELALDLPLLCALDEMEEFLSRARVTNLQVFRHAWNEIARRYLPSGSAEEAPSLIPTEDLWLYAPSLWSRPLAGISEALAAVSVLGTLPLGRRHQVLETAFSQLLDQEPGTDPFAGFGHAGYPSPYEEETVRKAAFAMADFLGL
ncbi:MAG TPA: M3 family metallopeptidase [Bacillota bacterium]|jgi:hypothetical protein|nr:hypothetical protein [Fastidiosipila sp.]HPX93896.1 M3 family metallopeptidase [Bacillota bacterium]HQB81792.1 M3 family metallopeptidase [Bacillota bacterium]